MPVGRPSEYTQDIADRICARLSDGESLRSVCRDEGMPDKASVFRWLRTHQEFCDQYAIAKEESAESHADDIKDIADDISKDYEIVDGEVRVNNEAIQRSRLRVDTRKWIASKLKPKKYGERIEHTGEVTLSLSDRMREVIGSPKA